MCLAVKKLPGDPACIVRQGKFFRYGSSRSAYLLCHPRSILCSCSVFLRILRLIVAAAYHIVHRAADILNALTDTTGHIFSGVADIIPKGISILSICTIRTVGIPIGALRHIIYIVFDGISVVLTSFLLSVCPMSLSVLVLPFPVSFVVLFPQAVIPASNTANASVIHTLLIFLIFKISFP